MDKESRIPEYIKYLLQQKIFKFILILIIGLLISLNILLLNKIFYFFHPFFVIIQTVFLPIILTGVGYYLLNPIVDYLEKYKVKRIYSIFLLFFILITMLTMVIMRVIPLFSEQIVSLINLFPIYTQEAKNTLESLVGNQSFNEMQALLGFDSAKIAAQFSSSVTSIMSTAWLSVGGFMGRFTETLLAIITVPLILFYLLKDRRKLAPYILNFVPTRLKNKSHTILLEMNNQISSYIRGQIIVSCCIGVSFYIGYLIIGLPYSLVLAVIAACTSIVPFLGPAIAITPALIVAMMTSPLMLLKMIFIWIIVQVFEAKFISPQIMGKSLKVHPVTIILVILCAGNLFGLVGILLGVPGYAVLKVITVHLFRWIKTHSGLYKAPTAGRAQQAASPKEQKFIPGTQKIPYGTPSQGMNSVSETKQ